MYALHRDGSFGWNSKTFEMFVNCFRIKGAKKPDNKSVSSNADSEQSADIGIIVAHVSAISTSNVKNDSHVTPPTPENRRKGNHTQRKPSVHSSGENQNHPLETIKIFASIIMFSQRENGVA